MPLFAEFEPTDNWGFLISQIVPIITAIGVLINILRTNKVHVDTNKSVSAVQNSIESASGDQQAIMDDMMKKIAESNDRLMTETLETLDKRVPVLIAKTVKEIKREDGKGAGVD